MKKHGVAGIGILPGTGTGKRQGPGIGTATARATATGTSTGTGVGTENTFLQCLQRTLRRTVWETCLIVEYCSLCVVENLTEAHVTCIETAVAYFGFFYKWCKGHFHLVFPLPTQCPVRNPRAPKPKSDQMQSP